MVNFNTEHEIYSHGQLHFMGINLQTKSKGEEEEVVVGILSFMCVTQLNWDSATVNISLRPFAGEVFRNFHDIVIE